MNKKLLWTVIFELILAGALGFLLGYRTSVFKFKTALDEACQVSVSQNTFRVFPVNKPPPDTCKFSTPDHAYFVFPCSEFVKVNSHGQTNSGTEAYLYPPLTDNCQAQLRICQDNLEFDAEQNCPLK
jgi:hypothetical protein